MGWGKLNSRIGFDGQFQFGSFNKRELELKFTTKKFNPQINSPVIFLIQKYFFHDNPTWNINYSE